VTRRATPIFVSHGAPTLVLEDAPARDFLAGLGNRVGRPDAIVVASAHWESPQPLVGAAPKFATIHDFYGFPRELYEQRYDAPGDPALAARVARELRDAGFAAGLDHSRGLDHGAWVPLKLAFPDADVPVVALSIQPALGPAHHIALGRALAGLADDNIWVLGSGSTTHNLREIAWGATAPVAWAREFEDWLAGAIAAGDVEALEKYRERAPHAVRAHPRDEHLLPLFVAFGAAGKGAKGERIHESFAHGSLSMAAYAFT
jgi:4,5-DOPA dioxygenase extradiol